MREKGPFPLHRYVVIIHCIGLREEEMWLIRLSRNLHLGRELSHSDSRAVQIMLQSVVRIPLSAFIVTVTFAEDDPREKLCANMGRDVHQFGKQFVTKVHDTEQDPKRD